MGRCPPSAPTPSVSPCSRTTSPRRFFIPGDTRGARPSSQRCHLSRFPEGRTGPGASPDSHLGRCQPVGAAGERILRIPVQFRERMSPSIHFHSSFSLSLLQKALQAPKIRPSRATNRPRCPHQVKPRPSAPALTAKPSPVFREESQIRGNIPKRGHHRRNCWAPLGFSTPAPACKFCIIIFWHPEPG